MCGIAGLWQQSGGDEATLAERIRRMADTLAHRGPDDEGYWVAPGAGVALGFRRLAILDLSSTGRQPMQSADGRFVVIFNGEIYNFRELRQELEARGVVFRGRSDTEVIVEGAATWGIAETIPRLWGMFALAIWDCRAEELVLARDRLGKKPLYYTETQGPLLFGSELKALRAHPDFRPALDRNATALYLHLGYVPAPYSIYAGVRKLPPGTWARCRRGQPPVVSRYWNPHAVAVEAQTSRLVLDEREAVEQFDALLRDAVSRRMIADVPLGAFLSGGIDSSTIVALMQAQSAARVKTFTIGFDASEYDEAQAAGAVARHLGTDHTELYVTPTEARQVIPQLPCLFDEPLADPSQIPTFLVSGLARRHVTVALSGDGGDELFAGYNRYADAELKWNRLRQVPAPVRHLAGWGLERTGALGMERALERIAWALPRRWPRGLEGYQLGLLGKLVAGDTHRVYDHLTSMWRAPEDVVIGADVIPRPLAPSADPGDVPSFLERMMLQDLVSYLPDDILVKVDRASMGVSLEARTPLLDHRIVEWAWRLPLCFKRRGSGTKWLLRQLLYRYVPAALVDRPKMGFGVPIDSWLRGPLRDWAEDLLDEGRLRASGVLRPGPVRRVWHAHLAGEPLQQYRLWAVLGLQAWLADYPVT
jgi:asparagine synthase (glutamine-hydrolysing)